MQGLRRVDGDGIPYEKSDDSTLEGGGDTTEMDNPGRGGRATDFPNDIPGKGTPAELPGRGMPRTISNEDDDAGTFYAPECPVNRGHF